MFLRQLLVKWFHLCSRSSISISPREERNSRYIRACITVKHRRSFDGLPARFLVTSLALERIMRLAICLIVVVEELLQIVATEVPFGCFVVVDDAGRQSLLMSLSLKDLLLEGASGDEAVHEAILLLPITPDTGKSLLVCRRIPV